MAFTIFGRSETGETSSKEVNHLATFLRPTIGSRINLPLQLITTLQETANSKSRQDLVCGGLISQIAVWKCNFQPFPMDRAQTLLSTAHLESSRWLNAYDSQLWRLSKDVEVRLPSEFTPALLPNRSDFLYPDDAFYVPPARHTAAPYPPPTRPAAPYSSSQYYFREESYQQHTSPAAAPGTEPWQQLMSQMGVLQQSFQHLVVDQQRALYPIYDDYYRMGKIPPDHTHPSWYQPPPFAGTFGAGGSGGGGSGAGQDDDDDGDNGEDIYDVDGSDSDD